MSPLLLPLAIHTRRTALRLAPAAGPVQGLAGPRYAGQPLRLLVLGESTVVGVGASCLQQALVGQLADELAVRHQRPVAWRALGENGITAEQACQRLLPQAEVEGLDWVVLVFGVNDCTHLTGLRRWHCALSRLATGLQAGGAVSVLTGVPPLQHFSALPRLMRWLLGARALQLDAQLQQVAAECGAHYAPMRLMFAAEYLALDGYHPSSIGYRAWAQDLAATISR
ncbi:SGNH/GDSL hydrolase family protein [Pseudomonas sp. RL_15y_Pfl2_60]|uniref:SGNH/GDSL hydrolase family protein n=1 Tax=Pseudomonas sp. RL_15y_Pfl2_60 TaxID=3088709 RepID=UPI0030D7E9CE